MADRGCRCGEGLITNGQLGGILWRDGAVLYLDCDGGYTTACACQNSQSRVKTHTTRVNFIGCKPYPKFLILNEI